MSSMSLHWQVPISATSIYGGIVTAVVTIIAVSVIIFLKLWKSRDKGISVPARTSTAPQQPPRPVDSAGDEGQLGISESVPSQTLPTTSESQFSNHNAGDESNPDILIPAQASTIPLLGQHVDHSAGDEGQLGILVPLPTTSEPQFIDQDARDKTISIPAQESLTSQPHGDVRSSEVPSITLSQGSSNFQISETNATIILNGDGQLTKIQRNLICDCIANLPDINNNPKEHNLTQSITTLPRAEALFNDYKNSGPCFKGTRVALLREMADCVTGSSESRVYVLSGLAGIGKSTVAYTIASRAADFNLLGAYFVFSPEKANRNNAKRFFTTIANQLRVYNEAFAKAIGDVFGTTSESLAATLNPQLQLKLFILDPLRSIVQSRSRPILIVVDALDECEEEDASSILNGLCKLGQDLPPFKVILTTRPRPYFDRFSQDGHKFFRLQDIQDKVVVGDIRLYLDHNLSMKQVQKCYPMRQWCASDEEIDSLVHAAGRFFIIASTTVRYILDKSASNPAAQMQKLLRASAQGHTSFKDLDRFYTAILRDVVPEDCDDNDIVSRYQSVVGTIIFVQHPLPVSTLAHLIDIDVEEIRAVLGKTQSVILLGDDDVPRIYHKSFPEYLMLCKDPHLRIDTRILHTQIAIRCFEIMCGHLRYNILGFGDLARFMSNEDGLEQDGITGEQLEEKIPQLLRYACIYWANHLEAANIEDAGLVNGLEKFLAKHMLHWFEVLSLVGKLDSAQLATLIGLKSLKSSSDLHQLLSDASCFIAKFYEIIKRSALHTYYSALPFTPTDSLLYCRYIKEVVHNICRIEGGPEKWEPLIANLSHDEPVHVLKFSLDSTLLVSCPLSYVASSSLDNIATLYNVNGSQSGTIFPTSSKIEKSALSSESSRVAAAAPNFGAVSLWDSRNTELIDRFDGFHYGGWLQFSPTGTRLAYKTGEIVKLWDGISGRFIADLRCGSIHKFEFSSDGSRIACDCAPDTLSLWNSESGRLIATVTDVSHSDLAISANGSLLATADPDKVKVWSEHNDSLEQIKVLEVDIVRKLESHGTLMVFSVDNILAIATEYGIKLYNVKTDSFISTLPFREIPVALAFSPDCTRLAVGGYYNANLWDIRGIVASGPPPKGDGVTALTLSRDCSRLACGFGDGAVELWGTSPTKRRIASHQAHKSSVRAFGFGPDGGLFASASEFPRIIKLWNGEDGSLRGTLKSHREFASVQSVALSNSVVVVAGSGFVTLWSLDTLSLIHTFMEPSYGTTTVSIAESNALIAVAHCDGVSLLDAEKNRTITTFTGIGGIHTMTFLPDNLQLVAQSKDGVFLSFNLINKHIMKGAATLEHLIQLPNISLWNGVQIWHCLDKEQHYFAPSFSQHNPVPVLWIPRHIPVTTWTQGSSMIALGCRDGRVVLLRLPTSHVG